MNNELARRVQSDCRRKAVGWNLHKALWGPAAVGILVYLVWGPWESLIAIVAGIGLGLWWFYKRLDGFIEREAKKLGKEIAEEWAEEMRVEKKGEQ